MLSCLRMQNMACKYAFGFVLVLIDLKISTSVPVHNFKFSSKIENCTFPPSITVPNVDINEKFYDQELKTCLNVDPQKAGSAIYLCQAIDQLLTPILCNPNIDSMQINITVPYPNEPDVCDGFAKLKNFSKDEDLLCRSGCTEHVKLCHFWLWVERINHILPGGVFLDSDSDDAPGNLLNNSNVTTIASSESVSNHRVNSEIESINPFTASDNFTVPIHASTSSTVQHIAMKAKETEIAATEVHVTTAYASSGLTSSTVHSTSEKIKDNEAVETDESPGNTNMSKVNGTENLSSNSNKDKTETKETKSPSTSMSPNMQSNEPTSFDSFGQEADEPGDMGIDPSREEIEDYSPLTGKTAGELSESITPEQLPDNKPQVQAKSGESGGFNAPGTVEDSNAPIGNEVPIQLMEAEDSHFFLYFLFVVGVVIGCYVLFHNKQKIIALIIEGRNERRRRPNGTTYRKLETK